MTPRTWRAPLTIATPAAIAMPSMFAKLVLTTTTTRFGGLGFVCA
jgi:hypothetical protein